MTLLDTHATNVIVESENDEMTLGQPGSFVQWTCPSTGEYYVEIEASNYTSPVFGSFHIKRVDNPCEVRGSVSGSAVDATEHHAGTIVFSDLSEYDNRPNRDCTWGVSCNSDNVVKLTFATFDFGDDGYVVIRGIDGSIDYNISGQSESNGTHFVSSNTSLMHIELHSPAQHHRYGNFTARYICIEPGAVSADPCDPNPCLHGGACQAEGFPVADHASCECAAGFTGDHCEETVAPPPPPPPADPCDPNPCLHGGACQAEGFPVADHASCECAAGFTGDHCEERVAAAPPPPPADPCDPNPCLHGGACQAEGFPVADHARCDCAAGFTGGHCEERVAPPPPPPADPCDPNPCLHGGACQAEGFPVADHTSCECAAGFIKM
eukprot:SAG31_NODE_5980_length_2227_cov_5.404605_2_plen_380_part_00